MSKVITCLRHKVTGQLFAVTPSLLLRQDLEPYEGPAYTSADIVEQGPEGLAELNTRTPESAPLEAVDLTPRVKAEKDVTVKTAAARKARQLAAKPTDPLAEMQILAVPDKEVPVVTMDPFATPMQELDTTAPSVDNFFGSPQDSDVEQQFD